MLYTDIDISKIKLTIKKNLNKNISNYINILYDENSKLIIKTPKLKIGYSAKKFESASKINYSYSLNITDNIEFINFIEKIESHILKNIYILKKNNLLNYKSTMNFNSVLYNPVNSEDIYFNIKLLTDKTNNIITLINFINRDIGTYNNLLLDNLTDQYIEFSGITITNEGNIYSSWYAHQIVISKKEKVFIQKSLLDELICNNSNNNSNHYSNNNSNNDSNSNYKQIEKNISSKPIVHNHNQNINTNKNIPFKIDTNMLLQMKSKLKKQN